MSATAESNRRPPLYVAVIADGNGRWAERRGLPASEGHEAGAETLKNRLCDAVEFGVRELTVYSFSTENWSRPRQEVEALMAMMSRRIATETNELHREGVRMRFIGRRGDLDDRLRARMSWAERLTAANRRITLCVAFNYGGRAEILDAALRWRGGGEQAFRAHLYACELHDPEVVIRTGGEQRLSNFLLWQSAHADLVFRDELWPDFDREALEQALSAPRHGEKHGASISAPDRTPV